MWLPDYGQGWMELTQLQLHTQQSSGLCENVRIIKCEIHILQMNIVFSPSDDVTRLGVGPAAPASLDKPEFLLGTPTALQNLFFHHTVWGLHCLPLIQTENHWKLLELLTDPSLCYTHTNSVVTRC